jgi:hypothetical protein
MGVEIDKDWVRLAKSFEDEITFFRKGGFNLPLKGKEKVSFFPSNKNNTIIYLCGLLT